jgi:predicted CxxxxCH...CXXCH cytochrome family protein
MMRKILLLIGILILATAASAFATALDAPHNQTNSFSCADCHNFGSFPVDDACLSCHINATGGGYSKNSAPKMLTHSSENTSTKYGVWTKLCKECHQPHTQQQRETYGSAPNLVTGTITKQTTNSPSAGFTTYTYTNANAINPDWANPATWNHKSANATNGNERGLILFPNLADFGRSAEIVSATATSITVKGYPGSVAAGSTFAILYGQHMSGSINQRPAKFFSNKGANSFAHDESGTGTDPTPDGVCQVCHTQTQHWRSDGTLAGIGVHAGLTGANCVTCHKHEEGFKAAGCNSCHGFPPINDVASGGPNGLVSTPAPTGSSTAGKHATHVNTVGIDCAGCHYNSKGSGPTHNDGTIQAITMGFYLFNGAVQGGAYNGQSGVDYNTTVTSPVTTVSSTGAKQCSNIYCHSTGQGTNGGALTGSDYKTPVWSGTVVCGDCHKSDGVQGTGTLMNSGSHLRHIDTLTHRKQCSECHNGAGSGTSKHVNNLIENSFSADPFGGTPSYSQSPNTPGNGYGSCSTVYCHSIGQRNGGTALAPGTSDYKNPSWGGTAICGACHAINISSGSHTPHLSVPGYDCINCHNNAGSGTIKHADRNIDIEFSGFAGTGTYSQNPNPPGNGYGSCSTTWCHGTMSPQWGTDLSAVAACEKCHGSAGTAALGTFKDTAGNTSGNRVGAHVSHLASTHNFTVDVACNKCHAVPASVTAAGHIDSALPAEVSGTIGYAGGGGSCSTTYCHGDNMPRGTTEGLNSIPAWNAVGYLNGTPSHDCAQCHGYPPMAIGAHAGAGPTTCIICHDHVNASGTGFTDPSKHVNGVLDGGGDDCSNCHTDANLSASHLKHSSPNTILAGKKLSLSDYGQAWFYSVSYLNGAPKFGCGYCHPNTSATHMNGVRNLNIDPTDAAAGGTVKAKNAYPSFTQISATSVTCSSVYCHSTGYDDGTGYYYQTSPDWYGGSFAGDKCANCHGNSPNTGGKTGSLSHYNPDAMGMGVVGGHFVGIHYNNVYDKTNGGVIKDAGNRQNAHGTAGTSSTINCQTCHNLTVTASGNDLNSICATCHTSPSKGTMSIDALSATHINGTPDVSFAAGTVNSKAQIRDNITTVAELNTSWTRNNGYKGGSTSFDGSKTAAAYNTGTKSCSSVACHNGNAVTWGAITITCNSCHTSLP